MLQVEPKTTDPYTTADTFNQQLHVRKRDGQMEEFDADKINRSIEAACTGLKDPIAKVSQIASETKLTLYDGITSEELDQATIQTALQNVKDDPDYDKVATRLLLKTVYKRLLGSYATAIELERRHFEHFPTYITDLVTRGLLDPRMEANFDLDRISSSLKIDRDEYFLYSGASSLLHRYALKDINQNPIETPQYFFMRVAMGLSFNEDNPTEQAVKFYDAMSSLRYLAGGSTNIGAGTLNSSLSNCFLMQIEDTIEHIGKSVSDVIRLSKATGGLGINLTKIRANGSNLSSNNTLASGPTPFAKIIDTSIRAISRGGKKKGAACFYMENWHLDFEDFLDWKHNAGDDYLRMRTANTAAYVSDEFMMRVENNSTWYLFDPKEVIDLVELYGSNFSRRYSEYCAMAEEGKLQSFKKMPATELYRKMIVALMGTSHPWIVFKDTINLRALNNNTGTIHMSNLCTEITLPQDEENIAVCNLASINLPRHLSFDHQGVPSINWDVLKDSVRLAVRQLDNLVDINKLPIPEAINADSQNRAIGLGVMGLADLFEQMGLSYSSDEAYELTDQIFEFLSFHAITTSHELALKRGSYPNFSGSGWSKGLVPIDTLDSVEGSRGQRILINHGHLATPSLDWDELRSKVRLGMRNATVMAIAPNANIGLVGSTTPGIDPRFAQIFSRNKISGKYLDLNHTLVRELVKLHLWETTREKIIENHGDLSLIEEIPDHIKTRFSSAFTTPPEAFIEVAGRAQKWVDQAISRNMYLVDRDIDLGMEVYLNCWRKGLKSTYYLHIQPRHSAEQSTTKVNKSLEMGRRGFANLHVSTSETEVVENTGTVVQVSEVQEILESPQAPVGFSPLLTKPPDTSSDVHLCPIDPMERLQCDSCQ